MPMQEVNLFDAVSSLQQHMNNSGWQVEGSSKSALYNTSSSPALTRARGWMACWESNGWGWTVGGVEMSAGLVCMAVCVQVSL